MTTMTKPKDKTYRHSEGVACSCIQPKNKDKDLLKVENIRKNFNLQKNMPNYYPEHNVSTHLKIDAQD